MKILVTGGCGFIGSAVCRYGAMVLGYDIVNVDALTYASTRGSTAVLEKAPNYRFYHANINDQGHIEQILQNEKPHAIVNLAAESHVDRSIDGPLAFVNTNVVGTVCLLEATRKYLASLSHDEASRFRFHHVSTDEVYGSLSHSDPAFSEQTPYAPNSPYAASKASSDHFVRAYHETYGLPTVLTNCSNNYGIFHFPEKLIPLVIIKALRNQPLPVYGTGKNVRDWLYVEDHARAIFTVLKQGRIGESYNVGGNEEHTNLEVVHSICDVLDEMLENGTGKSRRDLVTFVKDRPGHDMRYAIDNSKIKQELNWSPSVDFNIGIRTTVKWFLENQSWWEPILDSGKYGGERLGAAETEVKSA